MKRAFEFITVGALLIILFVVMLILNGCALNYIRIHNDNGSSCAIDLKTEETNYLEPSGSLKTPFLE